MRNNRRHEIFAPRRQQSLFHFSAQIHLIALRHLVRRVALRSLGDRVVKHYFFFVVFVSNRSFSVMIFIL